MSVVTGFVLTCREQFSTEAMDKIGAWMKANNFATPKELSWQFSGSKYPQIRCYGAGYNYFLWEEFLTLFHSLIWEYPENVVLLLNPEEGGITVHRPGDTK